MLSWVVLIPGLKVGDVLMGGIGSAEVARRRLSRVGDPMRVASVRSFSEAGVAEEGDGMGTPPSVCIVAQCS